MIQIILYEKMTTTATATMNENQTKNKWRKKNAQKDKGITQRINMKKLFNFRWFPHLAISQTVYFYLQHRLIGSDTHKFE